MPLALVRADGVLDISLFWVMVDISTLGKLGNIIFFGFEGGNSSVANNRKQLRLLCKIDTIHA